MADKPKLLRKLVSIEDPEEEFRSTPTFGKGSVFPSQNRSFKVQSSKGTIINVSANAIKPIPNKPTPRMVPLEKSKSSLMKTFAQMRPVTPTMNHTLSSSNMQSSFTKHSPKVKHVVQPEQPVTTTVKPRNPLRVKNHSTSFEPNPLTTSDSVGNKPRHNTNHRGKSMKSMIPSGSMAQITKKPSSRPSSIDPYPMELGSTFNPVKIQSTKSHSGMNTILNSPIISFFSPDNFKNSMARPLFKKTHSKKVIVETLDETMNTYSQDVTIKPIQTTFPNVTANTTVDHPRESSELKRSLNSSQKLSTSESKRKIPQLSREIPEVFRITPSPKVSARNDSMNKQTLKPSATEPFLLGKELLQHLPPVQINLRVRKPMNKSLNQMLSPKMFAIRNESGLDLRKPYIKFDALTLELH